MIEVKPGPYPNTTEIEGIVFADDFLKMFCRDLPEGQWFRIAKRENGVIVVDRTGPGCA